MVHHWRRIAFQNVRRSVSLMSLAAVYLAYMAAHADEPTVAEPVPPSPMSATAASTEAVESPASKLWQDRPLGSLKASINPTGGELPTNVAAPRLAEVGMRHYTFGESRPWMLNSYEWEAPATRHLPLLFEEPNLERLGYTYGCNCRGRGRQAVPRGADCLQPVVSGVRFFGRIPFIPYMYGYQCACKPVYTLGVDRPGSPVPYRKYMVPLSIKGAIYQAGAITGLVFFIP
jgi:hypothetical protein